MDLFYEQGPYTKEYRDPYKAFDQEKEKARKPDPLQPLYRLFLHWGIILYVLKTLFIGGSLVSPQISQIITEKVV